MHARFRLQFSLRMLLLAMTIVIAIVAVTTAYPYWYMALLFVFPWPTTILMSIMAFLLAAWIRLSPLSPYRNRWVRWLAYVPFLVSLSAGCYLIWSIDRWWEGAFNDPLFPIPLPYPDTLLNQFYDWLDVNNPPPPGMLKIHGEVDNGAFWLYVASFTACVLTAFQAGLLFPTLWFRRLRHAVSRAT